MKLHEILAQKGKEVYSVSSTATLAEMVEKLVEFNCGSMVVCDDGKMVGIITERDILKTMAGCTESLRDMKVAERMTRNVITAGLDDEVSTAMGLMTENRVRHMPVLNDGELVGMISIGDVVKAQHAELSLENHFMKSYIQS